MLLSPYLAVQEQRKKHGNTGYSVLMDIRKRQTEVHCTDSYNENRQGTLY